MMPFFSKGELRYNLTSVKDSPLGRFTDQNSVKEFVESFKKNDVAVEAKRQAFEETAKKYFSDFQDFEYESFYVSTKTKLQSATADRESIADELMAGRVMQVFGGKISGIFKVADRVNSWLGLEKESTKLSTLPGELS